MWVLTFKSKGMYIPPLSGGERENVQPCPQMWARMYIPLSSGERDVVRYVGLLIYF
jgi:hypothetical protein